MATGAVATKLPTMGVFMATGAIAAQAAELSQARPNGPGSSDAGFMAFGTLNLLMGTAKREFGAPMQVFASLPRRLGPIRFVVTGLTVHPCAVAAYRVFVAAAASRKCQTSVTRFGACSLVTLGTVHLSVTTAQLEAGTVVLKFTRRSETVLGVTVLALLPKGGRVGVLVAAGTGLFEAHPASAAGVALVARHFAVLPLECETRVAVVEILGRFPANHLERAAMVITVAFGAVLSGILGKLAVVGRPSGLAVAFDA